MVIHSFWIPELAGKQDVVPGRTNHILMQADEPGMYEGQCAEFCGLQHGRMLVRVRALSAEDWDAWVANQKQPGGHAHGSARPPGDGSVPGPALRTAVGRASRAMRSGARTRGVPPRRSSPTSPIPPTNASRGATGRRRDREALEAWLRDPDAVKLGAKMPNYHLTQEEIDALVAYLYSLK